MSWKYSGIVKGITHTPSGRKLVPSEKLFLLILADYSNEATGTSWPSVERLADECLCSTRTIRRLIVSMSQAGFITVERKEGQANRYTLLAEHSKSLFVTPDKFSPLTQLCPPTPDTAMSAKPSVEPSKRNKSILLTQLPEWLPINPWNSYLEMRMKMRRPLVTQRGIAQAINKLDKLRQQGHDPSMVLDQSIFNSWQGLFPLRDQVISGMKGASLDEQRKELERRAGIH